MAGLYPDVPGLRMPYDRDGTIAYYIDRNGNQTLVPWAMQPMNREDTAVYTNLSVVTGLPSAAGSIGYIFPELRDIQGVLFAADSGLNFTGTAYWWTSTNTTDGVNGTWVQQAIVTKQNLNKQRYRDSITAVSYSAVRAIRVSWTAFFGSNDFGHIFLYGSAATGENPDRLRGWHPTLNQEVTGAHFDFAEQPRAGTATISFRIKNNSPTKTANNITIADEALNDTTPDNVGQHVYSTDNITFAQTINIGSLTPGAISSLLYVKRDTLASAAIGLWWLRMVATASTFT
jgi:hypothetical protein